MRGVSKDGPPAPVLLILRDAAQTPLLRMRSHYFPARPRTCWMIPEKSTPPCPAASNAL